jgi:hypothetical protein
VGRGAESVDAESAARLDFTQLERPIADDARAEKRRGLGIAEDRRNRVREALRHHRVVGEAAVGVIAAELGMLAEVLASALTRLAESTGVAQPRDAHTVAGLEAPCARAPALDSTDDLMARHDRWPDERELALDDVQIGAAHAARADADQDLAGFRRWRRSSFETKRSGLDGRRSGKDERPHLAPNRDAGGPKRPSVRRWAHAPPALATSFFARARCGASTI